MPPVAQGLAGIDSTMWSLGDWFGVKMHAPFVVGEERRVGRLRIRGMEHVDVACGVVKEIVPERLFSFTWHPYGIDPKIDYSVEEPTLVTFTLEPTAEGTLLRRWWSRASDKVSRHGGGMSALPDERGRLDGADEEC